MTRSKASCSEGSSEVHAKAKEGKASSADSSGSDGGVVGDN